MPQERPPFTEEEQKIFLVTGSRFFNEFIVGTFLTFEAAIGFADLATKEIEKRVLADGEDSRVFSSFSVMEIPLFLTSTPPLNIMNELHKAKMNRRTVIREDK